MKGMVLGVMALVGASRPPATFEDSLKAGAPVMLPTVEVTAPALSWSMHLPPVRDAVPRALEMQGLDLIRRGPTFAADLFVDGFKRSDIPIVVDGEHMHNACPNRMDVPVVRANPLEMASAEVVLTSADLSAGLGGVLKVRRRTPARTFTPMGYIQGMGGSEEGLDAGLAMEGMGQGFYARYTRARPYTDARGRTFQNLYGFKTDVRTAYEVMEGSVHGVRGEWTYGGSVARYRDVLFPYLLMDERDNLGFSVFGAYRGHRVYANGFHHLMDNGLRASSGMMFMETDARTWAAGVTREGLYDVSVQRWIADNTQRMTMNNMPMETVQRMLDILRVRASVGFRMERAVWMIQGRMGAVYVSREDARRDLFALLGSSTLRRVFPVLALGVSRPLARAQIYGEVALEELDPGYLFVTLKRSKVNNMQKPYWIGNPDLRQPVKGALRVRVPFSHRGLALSVEAFGSGVKNYVEPGKTTADTLPVETFRNVDAVMAGFRLLGQIRFVHLESHYTWAHNLTDDLPLSEIPPLHLRLEVRPRLNRGGVAFTPLAAVTYEASQNRVNPELNESPTPAWTRLDLGLTVEWKGLRMEARVDNVTNELYYRHLSYRRNPFTSGVKVFEPGRRFTLSVWTGW